MDEIEFGQVEFHEPESEIRPDRDRQLCAIGCGEIDQAQLPIFVDLDVMRDMEGHARTNTHVELGGVLLGGKFLDENKRPFVVVREALRAEHYEATRGSFKFTHDTWAQITRDREELSEDLHLVGWYHTHPDWGVFLSGMDLFICDNFFNDDLDVDLVIDPCRGDRGWFFWDHVDGVRQKVRVNGFYLFSNRYRRTELLQFANALSETNPAYFDPRYESSMGESSMQPVVNVHEQKSPVLMVAVLGMLTIQMLVLGLIAWRVIFPPTAGFDQAQQQQRNEIYEEILNKMVRAEDPENSLVGSLQTLARENSQLQTNLDGNQLLIENQDKKYRASTALLEKKSKSLETKIADLQKERKRGEKLSSDLEKEKQINADIKEGKNIGGLSWWIAGSLAFALGLAGLFAGTLFGRRSAFYEDDLAPPSKRPLESEIPRPPEDSATTEAEPSDDADGMMFGNPDQRD